MAGATFKHKIRFTADDHEAFLRLPAAYDVIQIQLHIADGEEGAGLDQLLIQGVDEDDDLITLPGGNGVAGAFKLEKLGTIDPPDAVLQFSWKGPQLKFTINEVTAGLDLVVKVKTFMENSGDTDTNSPYPALTATAATGPTRSLRG